MASCHQMSRPSTIVTSDLVRWKTTHLLTDGQELSASSTVGFNLISAPRRYVPSWVITNEAWQS